jgi:hypothetical protein
VFESVLYFHTFIFSYNNWLIYIIDLSAKVCGASVVFIDSLILRSHFYHALVVQTLSLCSSFVVI